jgi:hypothetical protein
LLCCVTVAARVVPDSEGAEASLRDVLAAALDANREMARLAAVLREENARLRAEGAEQAAELERLRADLAVLQQMTAPGLQEPAKKALATLDREWDGLTAHRDYPMIGLDNNPAERALRRPVVTRKNAYGSRNEDAARLAARIWTVTASAQMADLNVIAYLTAYLDEFSRNHGCESVLWFSVCAVWCSSLAWLLPLPRTPGCVARHLL